MRIGVTGPVTKDFHVLGAAAMPLYLLDGEAPAIFDAPVTCLAALYEREIKAVLGERPPAYLFLTHSHFDHLGAAGRLKKVWPDMQIAAAPRVEEILKRPRAVELIRTLNRETAKAIKDWGFTGIIEDEFEPFALDVHLEPGREIDLGGGRTVKALSTPGHTWDFMSYWVERDKILVASEAVGCAEVDGSVVTEFLVDYDVYLESLRRLAALQPEILCQGHHYVYTDGDVQPRLAQALVQAEKYRLMVERFLAEEDGDVDRAANRIKVVEWEPKSWPKQSEPAYMLNTVARVGTLKARMMRRNDEL